MLSAFDLQYSPDFSDGLQDHDVDGLQLLLGLTRIVDEVRQDATEGATQVCLVDHGDLRDIPVWPQLPYQLVQWPVIGRADLHHRYVCPCRSDRLDKFPGPVQASE